MVGTSGSPPLQPSPLSPLIAELATIDGENPHTAALAEKRTNADIAIAGSLDSFAISDCSLEVV